MKGLNKILLVGCAVMSIACLDEIREKVNQKPTKEVVMNDEVVDLTNVIDEIKDVGELVLVRETGSASIEYNTSKDRWFSWLVNTKTVVSLDFECLIGIDLNDVTIIQNEDKLIVLTPTEFKLLAVETNNKDIKSDYSFLSQYEDHESIISLEEKIVEDIKENIITEEIKLEATKSFEDNIRQLAEQLNVEVEFY